MPLLTRNPQNSVPTPNSVAEKRPRESLIIDSLKKQPVLASAPKRQQLNPITQASQSRLRKNLPQDLISQIYQRLRKRKLRKTGPPWGTRHVRKINHVHHLALCRLNQQLACEDQDAKKSNRWTNQAA